MFYMKVVCVKFFKICFNIISALVHCKGGKIMFLDIFNNNEKMYIRISESYRVYSEEKKKFVKVGMLFSIPIFAGICSIF